MAEDENASDSIRDNREFDSNEIDESDSQHEKHDEPRISTPRGITIDSMDEEKNVSDSIRDNREFDSNEIDESDSQHEKHDEPRISTPRGITIDSMDECENALDSIRDNREFDSNDIQWNCTHRSKYPALTTEIDPGDHARTRRMGGDSCFHRVSPSIKPFRTTIRR
jgi:hypothetical protein